MNQEKIGSFISTLRKEKQLTQEQLGEKLGVSQKSISRWETGKNMPDISLLKPLSMELGITVSELIEGERQPVTDKTTEQSVDQIIEYTVKTRNSSAGLWNDINFITTVLIVLSIVLLVIGVVIQHLMIPLVVLGAVLIATGVRFMFCKCPGCGRTLPSELLASLRESVGWNRMEKELSDPKLSSFYHIIKPILEIINIFIRYFPVTI